VTMKKKLIIAGIISAVAALCFAAVFLIIRHAGKVSYSGAFTADVQERVVLERDANGIPLIMAKNINDVYFSLGFLHAQDRYNLMEYFRALAAGSTGSAVGKDGPILDRLSCAIGFAGRARELYRRLSEPYKSYLKDYVRGVNEARKRLKQKNMVQRDWTSDDVIAILLLREWANAFLNNKETIFPFQREAVSINLKEIVPEDMIYYYNENESDSVDVVRRIKKLVKKYIGTFGRGYAFYLPAQKIKDKYPVTAFGFEEGLSLYPGSYLVHVHIGERIIKGITQAGLPFIFSGNNLHIAFYAFTANIDSQDFLAETVIKTGKTYQYLSSAGWRDLDVIQNQNVQGRSAALHATENGPVLNDVLNNSEYGVSVVTMRSVFFGEDYIASLFEIPLSKTIEEAAARVRNIMSFPRVYLLTSDEKAISTWSGMVPVRAKTDSMFRSGMEAAWNGLMDLSVFRDVSEKDMSAGSSFFMDAPVQVRENAIREESRHKRLKRLMGKKLRFTNEDIENILGDRYSNTAGKFLPQFLSILGDNPMASARLTRIYFQNWKCSMKNDFVAPSVYHLLLQRFMYETYGDELKNEINDMLERWDLLAPQFLTLVKENKSPLFDDGTTFATEYREAIFDRAFLNTMRFLNRTLGPDMNDWSWGTVHRGHFFIPGGNDKIEDQPFEGGCDTLLLGSLESGLKPVDVTSISGFFGIEESFVSMSFAYSTNPGSKFYYGVKEQSGLLGFHEILGADVTTILPKKK
jgi:penicillin amidase